jgi:hypothetical protein
MKLIPQEVITDYLSTPAKTYEGMANLAQSIFEASNQLAKEAKPSLEVANGILANSNYLTILVGRASQLAFFHTQILAIQSSRKLDKEINDNSTKH